MAFDFEGDPQELIGREVIVTHSYTTTDTKSIKKIVWVGKTTFKVEGSETQFRLTDGHKAGKRSRMDWGTSASCELITKEQADKIKKSWFRAKQIRERATYIRTFQWEQYPELLDKVHKELIELNDKDKCGDTPK